MTDIEQRSAAKDFAEYWAGKGYEKGESQPFWLALLGTVFGVAHPEQYISFESQVKLDHTSFIDGFIQSTHVLIEQKSLGKDLKSAIKQSDGTLLSPFQQAKRYSAELPYDDRPRWIITCNFEEFHIYDMNQPRGEAEVIRLEDLPTEYYRLQFLVDSGNLHIKKEMEVSIQAGSLVGILYDALLKEYKDPTKKESLQSLNMLCVRLVFCLYAENAEIFPVRSMFHDYLKTFKPKDVRKALIELFVVLDTPYADRDPYMEEDLNAFPYVNGGLFSDEHIEIPHFTEEIIHILLDEASEDFNWKDISPTIFGAVFESTLNPETRRTGGMHYTSIQNIHKVIDPLFLSNLEQEFAQIISENVNKSRDKKLRLFQNKLSSLCFLDPACGSGNFLTETYLSLRRLENKVLDSLYHGQVMLDLVGETLIQVSIAQFYGIEINDFAVTVAKTALWIAESQMMKETEEIVRTNLDFLPLKTNAEIFEGNALTTDWGEVVPKEKLSYIVGNPPFVGMKYQNASQKKDMALVFKGIKNYGSLDFVASWYLVAGDFVRGTQIKVAFVSTNSITQGEQTGILWNPMLEKGMKIDFAHRTFRWDSEANAKAHVHCVIVGFSDISMFTEKILYSSDSTWKKVTNINPYLVEAPNILITNRTKPLCDVPKVIAGNKPVDGDFLKIEKEDYDEFIKKEPNSEKYIKKLVGGYELINNAKRYVLWLVGIQPNELRQMPLVLERVKKVQEARLAMKDEGARKLADNPTTFRDTLNPENYIAIPIVSSEKRKYVPMAFLDKDTIPTNQVQIVPNAEFYHFGILQSNVNMAWMRTVCGRLKSDYRYSAKIVYNNFPWCDPTEAQKKKIETTAKNILTARDLYPDSSLADLYDELTMPPELRKAHQENDRAVMAAYGFAIKMSESECVAELMKLYEGKAGENN